MSRRCRKYTQDENEAISKRRREEKYQERLRKARRERAVKIKKRFYKKYGCILSEKLRFVRKAIDRLEGK